MIRLKVFLSPDLRQGYLDDETDVDALFASIVKNYEKIVNFSEWEKIIE